MTNETFYPLKFIFSVDQFVQLATLLYYDFFFDPDVYFISSLT